MRGEDSSQKKKKKKTTKSLKAKFIGLSFNRWYVITILSTSEKVHTRVSVWDMWCQTSLEPKINSPSTPNFPLLFIPFLLCKHFHHFFFYTRRNDNAWPQHLDFMHLWEKRSPLFKSPGFLASCFNKIDLFSQERINKAAIFKGSGLQGASNKSVFFSPWNFYPGRPKSLVMTSLEVDYPCKFIFAALEEESHRQGDSPFAVCWVEGGFLEQLKWFSQSQRLRLQS